MLQTIRDAYTKSVISGEGDVPTAVQQAADKVTQLAGEQ
jgi:multiple sugar transport system substrate-binding protein